MKTLLIAILAVSVLCCGCSSVIFKFLDKFPDGEICFSVESEYRIIRICGSKETIEKEELAGEEEHEPEEPENKEVPSECLFPIVLNLQEELPPVPQNAVGTAERLITNVGFPIAMCLILVFMYWTLLRGIKEEMQDVNRNLKTLLEVLLKKEV